MDTTVSDVFAQSTRRRAAQLQPVLYLALQIDDLDAAPSRHRLDGVEVIVFGRGERAAIRSDLRGQSCLTIQVPDPTMSSAHGRLARVGGAWRFEDAKSKNGAVID